MANTTILSELDAAIDQGEDPDKILSAILAHFDAQTGTIHRLDDSDHLKLVAQIGVPDVILEKVTDIPIGKGIAGLAAKERRPVTICNIQTDASGVVNPNAKLTGMEGAIAVPMLEDGELRGTLGVGKLAEYTWSEAETKELEAIATLLCKAK